MHPNRHDAESLVWKFTAAGVLTGAVPVPAVSAAIVAENAAMIAAIGSAYGVRVSVASVVGSIGALGAVNMIGRTVFVEAARAMGWAAGPAGIAGVMALGATTAGLQTWCLGQVAIAIAENGGAELSGKAATRVLDEAKQSFPGVEELRKGVRTPA